MKESCENCKFWRAWTDYETLGQCRRFPPPTVVGNDFIFPRISSDGWCGEWKNNNKAPTVRPLTEEDMA